MTPFAESPSVAISPVFETVTLPAVSPLPPLPPSATLAAMPVEPCASTANPPVPPPPPIDCAEMPSASSPLVTISLAFVTPTACANPALPPGPPTARPMPQPGDTPPATAKPPLPPPPPIDCARMPSLCAPIVYNNVPVEFTLTTPALPPVPPLLPNACVNPPRPDVVLKPADTSNPPSPPPPPIDCASIACASSPLVAMLPEFVTSTSPELPPPSVPPKFNPSDAASVPVMLTPP